MKKFKNYGFTIIELLIVISIIGLLSSVVLASLSQARNKAQDASRKIAINQMNTAINLYISENGHAPYLQDDCKIPTTPNPVYPRDCIATENNNAPVAWLKTKIAFADTTLTPWDKLQLDLSKYLPKLPTDPCGVNCTGFGYKYISPAVLYFECITYTQKCNVSNINESSYQIYTPLKNDDTKFGYSSVKVDFIDPESTTYGSN